MIMKLGWVRWVGHIVLKINVYEVSIGRFIGHKTFRIPEIIFADIEMNLIQRG
jgi:hypothetical protein